MDNEVKPTWRLAWGLWWRMFLISLGIGVIITLILGLVSMSLINWLVPW
jgi:endo-1,4-beta-mannosidase